MRLFKPKREIKVVRVKHGILGRINTKGIERTIEHWYNKGFQLEQQIEQRGFTQLTFLKEASTIKPSRTASTPIISSSTIPSQPVKKSSSTVALIVGLSCGVMILAAILFPPPKSTSKPTATSANIIAPRASTPVQARGTSTNTTEIAVGITPGISTKVAQAVPSDTITPTPSPNLAATEAWWSGEQTRAALGLIAQSTNIALTRVAPVAQSGSFNRADYERQIWDGLFILAGGRNVQNVVVTDGRALGGERGVLVGYLTTESTEVGYVNEWIDLFQAVAATIRADELDLDAVSLIMGTPTGLAAASLVAQVDNLMAFYEGIINQVTFMSRLSIENFLQ